MFEMLNIKYFLLQSKYFHIECNKVVLFHQVCASNDSIFSKPLGCLVSSLFLSVHKLVYKGNRTTWQCFLREFLLYDTLPWISLLPPFNLLAPLTLHRKAPSIRSMQGRI